MSSEAQYDGDVESVGAALGSAIAELPEYEAFTDAERAVATSTEAQAQIEAFETQREQFMVARQLGEATQEDIAELQQLQADLHALPVMEAYLEAQAALDDRLAAINQAISDGLEIDFAGQAGACCHD